MQSKLSTERCFQLENMQNAPVQGSTASIIPSYLPQNQINFECLPTHVILGDQTLCPF